MSMVNISFIDSLSSSPHTLNFTPTLQVAKDVTPKFIPPRFLSYHHSAHQTYLKYT